MGDLKGFPLHYVTRKSNFPTRDQLRWPQFYLKLLWITLGNGIPQSVHRHTWWVHTDFSPLWNAEHCGHCITAPKNSVFGKKLKNKNKHNFFTKFQTLLAALFDLSSSVIAVITAVHQRRNTGGSRKDYTFSEITTLAIFNLTAAIDTQHTSEVLV